jgi:hypothetical protein
MWICNNTLKYKDHNRLKKCISCLSNTFLQMRDLTKYYCISFIEYLSKMTEKDRKM